MKKELDIAVNYTKVVAERVSINLPDNPRYYLQPDSGNEEFPGILAIIPKSVDNSFYYIISVKKNKQSFSTFLPAECILPSFREPDKHLCRLALDILLGRQQFKEITEDEFNTRRDINLNFWKS